jgi:two-component system chemotaxis response regulator CheY
MNRDRESRTFRKDKPMRALVIDDSRVMRSILGSLLKKAGFEVAEAGNGQEGLDRLRHLGKPDVVLADWNMPVMDGLEFVRAVRADSLFGAVPVIMVTTETELAQVSQALDAGASAYLTKPFDREALADKLRLLGLCAG